MGKKYSFDYIVIGSGPAGFTAAMELKKAKKNVAIVEGGDFGGANISTRDLPYNISLDFSHSYHKFTSLPAVSGQDFHFNFPTTVSHQEYFKDMLSKDTRKSLEDAEIKCIDGYAHFIDENTIIVNSQEYTAAKFILATGSHLKTSEIAGLESVNYLTPDTALKARRLPKFVFVIGGGATGCEIASYYAELGVRVLIMERDARLLPHEDKEIGDEIKNYFKNELGIMVIENTKVVAIEQDNISKRVIFTSNAEEKMVRVDCIVLATGSEPILDYGLENANIKYRRTGITVNRFFQTSAKNVYAIGDCLGNQDSSSERAEYEARILVKNLIKKNKFQPNYNGFIRKMNAFENVAVVGINENDLMKRDLKFKKSIVYLKDTVLAKIINSEYGFVKLLADPKSRKILGATVVSENALDIASELALAVREHLTAEDLYSLPHDANSFSALINLAAKKLIK